MEHVYTKFGNYSLSSGFIIWHFLKNVSFLRFNIILSKKLQYLEIDVATLWELTVSYSNCSMPHKYSKCAARTRMLGSHWNDNLDVIRLTAFSASNSSK